MRSFHAAATLLVCSLLHLAASLPVDQPVAAVAAVAEPQEQQETLMTLDLGNPNSDQSLRDKRTIGFLRQLFPGLSQIVDNKIQMITRFLFRVIGRVVLRGGLLGGGGGGGGASSSSSSSSSGSSGGGRRISITLPTYPPDADDEEEEEEENENSTDDNNLAASDLNPEGENQLAGAESQQNEVRVPYIDPQQSYVDQEGAASGGNDEVEDNVEAADGDSEDRPKRGFLNFGFGGSAGAGADSSSGSGAGSGNFLFDIIRQTATRAARAAGTVYRVVAGTESLDLGLGVSTSKTTTTATNKTTTLTTNGTLVAGSSSSGGSSSGDSGEDGQSAGISASGEVQAERDNGYQAGIPGPITRLLIIANRGLANLMQDLILRLAQTSERIVNFKARLITAII